MRRSFYALARTAAIVIFPTGVKRLLVRYNFCFPPNARSQNIQNLILTAEQMGDLKKRNLRLLISCFIVKHSYDSRYPAHNWPAGSLKNKFLGLRFLKASR